VHPLAPRFLGFAGKMITILPLTLTFSVVTVGILPHPDIALLERHDRYCWLYQIGIIRWETRAPALRSARASASRVAA
jgi:hypothetical protein